MKSMYDLIVPLNRQLRRIFRDIEEGGNIEYDQTAIKDIATFLKPEMERGLIFKMNCGLYAARFCELCRLKDGQLYRPMVFGYTCNIGQHLWDKWSRERIENGGGEPAGMREALRTLRKELEGQGLRDSFLLDTVRHRDGKFWAVRCPGCGLTSWWAESQETASEAFDETVMRQLRSVNEEKEM